MPWTHLASSAPSGTTKGSVDRGRSFEVRERRGPKVSFPESPFRDGEGIRGGGTPLRFPLSLATPMQPPGAVAGIPRGRTGQPSYSGNPLPQAAADSSSLLASRARPAAHSFVSRSPGEPPAEEGERAGRSPAWRWVGGKG